MLVCTDAAARGIDIPDVTHVVQSSFAASAIDFLHRVSLSVLVSTAACARGAVGCLFIITGCSCQRKGASADKQQVKATTNTALDGLANSKQHPIYRGHGA